MDGFTQKLRLIYTKVFNEDMDKFTEEFIDIKKFKKSGQQSRKQFFLNRKTVLRRWLKKKISCTSDFKKSFANYNISLYQFRGTILFSLDDFKEHNNLEAFEQKIDLYLQYKQEVYVNKEYQHIYIFSIEKKEILLYSIVKWEKNLKNEVIITLENEGDTYKGTFSLCEDSNIFIKMKIEKSTLYLLFHDNKDSSRYIVGTSMGDNTGYDKVPTSQKVVFAKEKLDTEEMELTFILNETESLSLIESKLNLNIKEVKIGHFVKYTNKFKQYHNFFNRLIGRKYHQQFYYRLAFREFYAFFRLFENFSKKETYFILNYQRAFLEAIKTVESIQNIPFFIVMELNEKNLFFANSDKELEIRDRFFNLFAYGVKPTIIFIVEDITTLSKPYKELLHEIKEHNIEVKVVEKEKIVHDVNSLDFFFIHLGDDRDFVLADPIRDNKDVFKLFIDKVTLDEYRSDYRKIDVRSEIF